MSVSRAFSTGAQMATRRAWAKAAAAAAVRHPLCASLSEVASLRTAETACSSTRGVRTAAIIRVPISLGQPLLGPDRSPQLLLERGLLKMLDECGWATEVLPEIKNSDDVRRKGGGDGLNAKNVAEVGRVCERIFATVLEQAQTEDKFLLILGGDHCIPIGTIPGIVRARPSTGIVWVDAHADINTPQSSLSGNMHGMPLAFLLGLVSPAPQSFPYMQWFPMQPCLQPQDLVYIGLRDLDKAEKDVIKRLKIKAFTMYDVDRLGIGSVMEQTLDYLDKKKHIHLSYDIDALDPFFAPSTGTASIGGLTFREGNFICEFLHQSTKLSSMELVEINPSLHSDLDSEKTIDMAMALLGSTMGQKIL